MDPTDTDAVHTALREVFLTLPFFLFILQTEEEIGILPEVIRIYGLYHDVPSRDSVCNF